jgi:hypothetical protein
MSEFLLILLQVVRLAHEVALLLEKLNLLPTF